MQDGALSDIRRRRSALPFARSLSAILIVALLTTVLGCSRYANVRPGSRLSKARVGMGDTELRETIGMWDDSGVKKYPLNMVICVALALLIFPPLFMDPPLVGQVHYYKGEGRVYLKSGWFDLNDRVYRVVGDPSEDGYK